MFRRRIADPAYIVAVSREGHEAIFCSFLPDEALQFNGKAREGVKG